MSTPELSLRALNRATLARQMLLERATVPVETAVARLAGMQAQIPRPPYLGLWTRLAGFERAVLTAALHARRVVRATAWRGTLHLLTADDLRTFRGSLQEMLSRGMRSVLGGRVEGLDMVALLAEARGFFAAKPASFEAARAHLATRFPVDDARFLGYAVRTHLPLVQVPDGSAWGFPAAAAFALAEHWLEREIPSGSDGLPALVRRYLAAFGPASARTPRTGPASAACARPSRRCAASSRPTATSAGASSSTCRMRRVRTRRRPRRRASSPSTTTSCSAMTTAAAWSPTPTGRG